MILKLNLYISHLILEQIQAKRQALVDERLIAANTKRFNYDYKVGGQVLKVSYNPAKLEPRATGPFHILRVHTNGTLTIELSNGVEEHINIRRVKPYRT